MTTYIIVLILITVTAVVVFNININIKKKNKIFLIISFLILTFVSAFRGINVGTDTKNYVTIFMRYVHNMPDPHSEIGFATFNAIIARFTENPQVIIIVSSIIIHLGLMTFIYNNSKNAWLSVYLYITLYYYFFSFNYVRQFIAMAIILYSWHLLKERRYTIFFILIILGTTFHFTAFIGILLLFVYWGRKSTKIVPWIIGGSIALLFGINIFLEYVFQIFPRYSYYDGAYLEKDGGIMIVVLYISIFISTLILKKKESSEEYNMLFIIASICAALSILGYNYFIFVRPSLYFNVFSILIIPELIERFGKRDQVLISYVICILGFLYMLYYFNFNWHNILPYELFF